MKIRLLMRKVIMESSFAPKRVVLAKVLFKKLGDKCACLGTGSREPEQTRAQKLATLVVDYAHE